MGTYIFRVVNAIETPVDHTRSLAFTHCNFNLSLKWRRNVSEISCASHLFSIFFCFASNVFLLNTFFAFANKISTKSLKISFWFVCSLLQQQFYYFSWIYAILWDVIKKSIENSSTHIIFYLSALLGSAAVVALFQPTFIFEGEKIYQKNLDKTFTTSTTWHTFKTSSTLAAAELRKNLIAT